MATKTKSTKPVSKKGPGVGQSLSNQRVVLWILVGFVAFLTLWMLYTVKAMQAESVSTASEAAPTGQWAKYAEGVSCTPAEAGRGNPAGVRTVRRTEGGKIVSYTSRCCKVPGTAKYQYFSGTTCPSTFTGNLVKDKSGDLRPAGGQYGNPVGGFQGRPTIAVPTVSIIRK